MNVGPANSIKTFTVHKGLLCAKADYFKQMFNGGYAETSNLAADFPEDDPQAFSLLVGWLYTGRIEKFRENGYVMDLIKLFGLAEKFLMPDLADDAIIQLIEYLKSVGASLDLPQTELAYGITHEKSRLRLLAARTYVFVTLHFSDKVNQGAWTSKKLQETAKRHDDLLLDVLSVMRLQAGKLRVDPKYEHICDYHQHRKNEPCPHTEEGAVKHAAKK